MAKLNPETGLDCVSAGAVRRRQSADAVRPAERKDLAGDQTAEQVKHTLGPWSVEVLETSRGWTDPVQNITIKSERHLIAFFQTSYIEYPDDETNAANARLIAAAPDMLAALKALHELYKPLLKYVGDDHIALQWVAAIAAIAKAEGRS